MVLIESSFNELTETICPVFFRVGENLVPIGSAFIVAANEDKAILMTASHVLDEARSNDLPSTVAAHPTAIFTMEGQNCIHEFNDMKVVIWVTIGPMPVPVVELTLDWAVNHRSLDVSVIYASVNGIVPIYKRLFLKSKGPDVGDKVLVTGFSGTAVESMKHIDVSRAQFVYTSATVTEVYENGFRQFRWPCFRVDCPNYSGMSGGAVLAEYNGKWAACGIVSSDITLGLSASGEAAIASMIWPLFNTPIPDGLSFGEKVDGGPDVLHHPSQFLDLAQIGIIKDYSNAQDRLQFTTDPDGVWRGVWTD